MSGLNALIAAFAGVVLFLYGLQGFSRELRAVGGTALQAWLARVTASRWLGFLVGALATSVVQSSSAITALAVALVDASAISFRASLGVLLGANVGTTATAWLVSLKLTGIGALCIVLGAVVSMLPSRVSTTGKAVFYFGLIFFALDLISAEIRPLQGQRYFMDALLLARSPWVGVLLGVVVTALIQSSSVTVGVAILLVQQGALPPEAAIPIVVGANVGSTSTALVASLAMNATARATAMANLLFNTAGMLAVLPVLPAFSRRITELAGDPGIAVAWAHLAFNLVIAAAFLLTLDWVEPRLRAWLTQRTPVSPPASSTPGAPQEPGDPLRPPAS